MIESLHEALADAEQQLIESEDYEHRRAAVEAWITIADLLQKLGEQDCHI